MTSSKASTFHSRVNEDFDKPAPLPPRGAAQSRFIPREELDGFAAWRPGSFGGGATPSPHPAVKQTVAMPPATPSMVRAASALDHAGPNHLGRMRGPVHPRSPRLPNQAQEHPMTFPP